MDKIEETRDVERVRRILTEPRVWRQMSDDRWPAREEFRINRLPDGQRFLVPVWNEEDLGVFVVVDDGPRCGVHFAMLPKAWGPLARAAADAFLAWLWSETQYSVAVGYIAAYNKLAIAMAGEFGFVETQRYPREYERDGVAYDSIEVRARRPGTL